MRIAPGPSSNLPRVTPSPLWRVVTVAALLAVPAAAVAAAPTQTTQSGHAARAQPKPAATASGSPKAIGRFEDWTAATHLEAGLTVCYAFTRAASSAPSVPGRGEVVLTVTERPGAARDAVAITAGFAYAPNAAVALDVDGAKYPFYTSQRSAFARDGRAVTGAFGRGRQAASRSPLPRGGDVNDVFSLHGFSAAYAAIVKACPVR